MAANVTVVREQGGDLLRVYSGGEIQVDSGATLDLDGTTALDGTVSIGGVTLTQPTDALTAGTGVAASAGCVVLHSDVLTLSSDTVAMTDATTKGCHGSMHLCTFPQGGVSILSCRPDLTITAGAGGIADTAALVASVGSAAVGTDNETLTSTEANVVASTACTLSSGAGTMDTVGVPVNLDGAASASKLYLNLAVPDADSSGSDTITLSGTITVTWVNVP